MPLLSKRNPDRFYDLQIDAFIKSGLSTRAASGDIARGIAEATRDLLSIPYSEFYAVTDNILPNEATGIYLDRYGIMLGESRRLISPAKDLSLNNVYLTLPGNLLASQITIDGDAIRLPPNIEVSNIDGTIRGRILNAAVFAPNSNRAYCQITITSGQESVAANSLVFASVNLTSIPNVDIRAIQNGQITVQQPLDIVSNSVGLFEDSQFLFLLTKAAEGLGTGNRSSIEAELIKIPNIARYQIVEHTHGNSSLTIFVESTELQFTNEFLKAIESQVKRKVSVGTRLRVEQPVIVKLGLVIAINRTTTADEKIVLSESLQDRINNLRSGTGITLEQLIQWIRDAGYEGQIVNVQRNDRDAPLQDIVVRSTQKLGVFAASNIIIQ